MTAVQAANRYIPTSDNRKLVVYKEGTTGDIIKEVLSTYQHCRADLNKFAPALQKGTENETCKAIWNFVKKNISYKIDPIGKQFIKTPARIWQDKQCDCKGYSIFIACCLTSLGLPVKFRFVSFDNTDIPTHVYVVCNNNILDCVMNQYNKEHSYTNKKEFDMTEISRLSGMPVIGTTSLLENRKFGEFKLPTIGCTCTDAVDTALLLQRLETEMFAEMHTAGWTDSRLAHYQDAIRHCKELIKSYESASVAGIFDELKRVVNSGTRTGIVAALQKPEIAYCFLYGFIPDGPFAQNRNAKDHISKLPAAFREKKAKQVELYQWIVSTYKLRDPEFWQPVRATLTTFFGKSPEAFLNDILVDNIQDREAVITGKPGGIMGFLSDAFEMVTDVIPGTSIVKKAGNLFTSLFGKKADTVASELGVNIPTHLSLDSIKPGEELAAYLSTNTETTPPNLLDNPIITPTRVLDIFTVQPQENTVQKKALALYARRNDGAVQIIPQPDGSVDYLDIQTGERYNIDNNLNATISTRTGTGDPYGAGYKDLPPVTVGPQTQDNKTPIYIGLALLAFLALKNR